ncbi:hypothetical protein GTW98_17625 [Streptomyces sp. SID8375]|uniref:hypothetical protein n=1 Tax=unclassified Streptomyces TaxID=2593676 RepID=UPI0011DF731A|nr:MULTISPECIES: hypothetical protein [unclassified Streptomyces]MYX08601.1 hypothetical protein [Streptomyces sp. SID8375]
MAVANASALKQDQGIQSSQAALCRVCRTTVAVKWIGNVGSHEDRLQIPDVLDGVEILDFTLELVYDNRRDELKKKAAAIIARQGIPENIGGFST